MCRYLSAGHQLKGNRNAYAYVQDHTATMIPHFSYIFVNFKLLVFEVVLEHEKNLTLRPGILFTLEDARSLALSFKNQEVFN